MTPIEPLALTHSWPLYEAARRLSLDGIVPFDPDIAMPGLEEDALAALGLGVWYCDLRDESLRWSKAVHDLFGIPQDEAPSRPLAVSLYLPDSRIAMEQLRTHAIRHRRGFTMDARIRRPDGDIRWMRLSALPILAGTQVVRLCGTKQDVTWEYDGIG